MFRGRRSAWVGFVQFRALRQYEVVVLSPADWGVAVDALVTNRVWTAMGLDPATTLHDVRWGEEFDGQFVWVF